MKTKQLLLFASCLSLMGMNACSNALEDMDVLGNDKQPFWDEENIITSGIIIDNDGKDTKDSVMMLRLINKTKLRVSKNMLTLDDFFGTGEACFPAYRDSIIQFELYSFDELKNDTLMYHFKMDYLRNCVDSLLNDSYNYSVYELTWNYRGVILNTIALYDNDNNLVYDNILSNIVIINIKSSKDKKKMLSRTESPYTGSGYDFDSETVTYTINNSYSGYTSMGEVTFYWIEYGHWDTAPIYEGTQLVARHHHYVHDNIIHFADYYITGQNTSFLYKFRDYSEVDKSQFVYCIWIGPTSEVPYVDDLLTPYIPGKVIDLREESINAYSHSYYGGFLRMIQIAPESYIDSVR